MDRSGKFNSAEMGKRLKRQEKNASENVVCWSRLLQMIA